MNDDADQKKVKFKDLLDPNHPQHEEIYKRITNYIESNPVLIEKISQAISSFSGFVDTTLPKLQKLYSETAELMRRARDEREIVYPDIVDKLDFLADNCWFMSMYIDLVGFEQQVLSLSDIQEYKSNTDRVDENFVAFYQEYEQNIFSNIVDRFPDRAPVVKSAFEAHLRGEYALSVPVFFSQADGILFKLTQKELFSGRENIAPWAKDKIEKSPNNILAFFLMDAAVWTPLSVVRPFAWAEKNRNKHGYNGLNRNTVLHGLDISYATRVNSYKAFSLLAYVASLEDVLDPNLWVTPSSERL